MPGGRNKLTPKQRVFVDEYLKDLNAKQAAIRAGYSEKNADKIGSELLGKTGVSSAIEEAMAARARRTQIDADWVLKRLIKMADYDQKDFSTLEKVKRTFMVNGAPVEVEVQDVVFNEDFDGSIVSGLSKGKDGIKMELPDKTKVLELIGKHIGMWKEKIEHSGNMGVEVSGSVSLRHLTDDELEAEYKKLKGDAE